MSSFYFKYTRHGVDANSEYNICVTFVSRILEYSSDLLIDKGSILRFKFSASFHNVKFLCYIAGASLNLSLLLLFTIFY